MNDFIHVVRENMHHVNPGVPWCPCSDCNHSVLCRLQMMEAALALSEQKNHNMGELLTQVKAEKEEQLERWSREKKKELEARTLLIKP